MKRKIIVYITLVSLLFVISGCGKTENVALVDNLQTPDFAHDTPTGEITSESNVDQTFVSNCNVITRIDLYGATYMRTNKGNVDVKIYTSSNEDIRNQQSSDLVLIAGWSLDASKFEDNKIISLEVSEDYPAASDGLCLSFEQGSANKKLLGKTCMIVISSADCVPGSSITFWTTQEDVYDNGCVRIGDYEWYNDLWFQVYGTK